MRPHLIDAAIVFFALAGMLDGASSVTSRTARASERVQTIIMPRVAELRGLEFKKPVPVKFTTVDKVVDYIGKAIDEEMPPPKLEGYERLFKHLGLMDEDMDLRKTLINAYSNSVVAFYDDEDESFSMVTGSPASGILDDMTIAHELTHALQDQYYDLGALNHLVSGNDDASLAVMALAEGDASDIMMRYQEKAPARGKGPLRDYGRFLAMNLGAESMPGLPLIFAQDMIFPYTYGARFVTAIIREDGARAVDIAFRDPPVSTEQVIRPDRYLHRQEPYLIEIPDVADALPEGWSLLDSGPLGQFNTGILLAVHLGEWGVDAAVEGWNGDVLAGFVGPSGAVCVAFYSTWDSPGAAAAFFGAAERLAEVRVPHAAECVREEGTLATWLEGDRLTYLRRRGSDVLYVEDAPRKAAGEMIVRLWQSKKTPFGIARPIADRDRRKASEAPDG